MSENTKTSRIGSSLADASARFLSVAEIAARWGCSKTTVYDEIRAGHLRAMTIGTQAKRVALAELQRYETERTGVAS